MKFNFTSAVWSGVYLLLLLSLQYPALSIFTLFVMIVPVVILFNMLNTKQFIVHMVLVWAIALLIRFDLTLLIMAVYFAIPALVMGMCYKRRVSSLRTILLGAATILVEILLMLFLGSLVFQFNLAEYIEDITNMIMAPLLDASSNPFMSSMPWTQDDVNRLSKVTVLKIPYALIVSSFVMAIIAHALARPTLTNLGHNVPKLKPAHEWRFPRSLIWYYLLSVVIEIIALNSDSSYLTLLSANMGPVIDVFFRIQAIGFFFYLAYTRKWNTVIPVLIAFPVVIFPPMVIIGILDIAFPLRQFMTKSK
ncbi:DUF2232 domain-containing protein [Paenibacillus sp. IHBB 10380]|uniref:DUF2232 domain-containing protein n=1 Tax=Paenibacillus sp. IHBB 10380 TaxID=1566358 RepID=UPI0005CFCED7|nr:DUF2232 domain-containing protein [Paenibacillus sp. IHBB 10380]AJS60673.1 membrane protein [Paenibacillus sp. IHBB 10380]